ncbi:hypothetical protein [Bacillus toyonensis]|uniref:hypothetical protein n=1 Tax=Bacillus toyonensis TaxID=155322 RepID=UPI001EDD610E|nr:hypothetical protein [Bacillus toyonensis]UKS59295.1 hypothetical protein K6T24_20560 [Bacillus toyonensis]
MMTENMIKAITEIAEMGAEIWDVFDICDKHMLSTGEEALVIAMYEESKQDLLVILQQEQIEETEVNEALKMLSHHNNMQPISLDNINDNGFK